VTGEPLTAEAILHELDARGCVAVVTGALDDPCGVCWNCLARAEHELLRARLEQAERERDKLRDGDSDAAYTRAAREHLAFTDKYRKANAALRDEVAELSAALVQARQALRDILDVGSTATGYDELEACIDIARAALAAAGEPGAGAEKLPPVEFEHACGHPHDGEVLRTRDHRGRRRQSQRDGDMSDPATDALLSLWRTHGDLIAEIHVSEYDGEMWFNVQLSNADTDEAIGIVSYNGRSVIEALERAAKGEARV